MSQQELLNRVVRVLEGAGIDYMVTGSFASSLQGEPRMTHHVDLVVAIPESAVGALMDAFPAPDYYLDPDAVLEAIRAGDMFNLLDITDGDKVDFWLLTDEPFDRSRFARRYEDVAMGMRFFVSSPEDTILAKLRWAKLSGGSERQFTDALRVFEVQSGKLDLQYLRAWASKLSVESLLNDLMDVAES